MQITEEIELAFKKAKIGLIRNPGSVFITTVVFSLRFRWTEDIPTAGVDGISLLVNPKFFMALSPSARISLLAHEGWHIALQHIGRCGTRDKKKHNAAADFVINSILKEAGFELGDGWLYDPQYKTMGTNEVYDLLPMSPENPLDGDVMEAGDGTPDDGQDKHLDKSQDAIDAAIDRIISKAHAQAKIQGQEKAASMQSVDLARKLDELFNPVIPWNTVLLNYMSQLDTDDYSMRRPNKYFMPDFYLPSQDGECLGHIAVAIDTSGSVSPLEFTAFISEIHAIKEMLNPKLTTVIDFDCEIQSVALLGQDDPVTDVEFKGGGGTDLQPIFDYMEGVELPEVLIVFSDLYCNPITVDPGYDVIWVCIDHPDATTHFGRKIDFDTAKIAK